MKMVRRTLGPIVQPRWRWAASRSLRREAGTARGPHGPANTRNLNPADKGLVTWLSGGSLGNWNSLISIYPKISPHGGLQRREGNAYLWDAANFKCRETEPPLSSSLWWNVFGVWAFPLGHVLWLWMALVKFSSVNFLWAVVTAALFRFWMHISTTLIFILNTFRIHVYKAKYLK